LNRAPVCFVLLAHQPPAELRQILDGWTTFVTAPDELLLCYGGRECDFGQIEYSPKLFLDDPRLRTRDHQRERQSYTQLFQKVGQWLERHPAANYVYLAEYDHRPLVGDLADRLVERLHRENADVLGHHLYRRDRTSCPYYLSHVALPGFSDWLRKISRRQETDAVFNMFGSGSFWTREAFLAVAGRDEPLPIYLETYLPTLAHHLGFRLRDFEEQNRFVFPQGDRQGEIETARAQGAWTLHPVKSTPDCLTTGKTSERSS
jgi:hypothetical protein